MLILRKKKLFITCTKTLYLYIDNSIIQKCYGNDYKRHDYSCYLDVFLFASIKTHSVSRFRFILRWNIQVSSFAISFIMWISIVVDFWGLLIFSMIIRLLSSCQLVLQFFVDIILLSFLAHILQVYSLPNSLFLLN